MLIFDQLKKNDLQLQLLALVIFGCLAVLLAGLWWVQIVHARDYTSSLETQSYRTVRLPAVRGKILDRNGQVLAESRATYNVSLFLEDLSKSFQKEYRNLRPKVTVTNSLPFWKRWLGFEAVKTVRAKLNDKQIADLQAEARYCVVSNTVQKLAAQLGTPLTLDPEKFRKHYETARAMPYPILPNATAAQVARFSESASGRIAADLEVQTTRVYPFGSTAAHLMGYVVRRKEGESVANEQAYYSYRLPDFSGMTGIEKRYDLELRGNAGEKTVVVNNLGYRQNETVENPAEPGTNVVLTIDLAVQQSAEAAIRRYAGLDAHAAVVAMDVWSGDVLALASSPTPDPNNFIKGFSDRDRERWSDEELGVQKNRAMSENYQAGSTFKTIVALAALEKGLDPNQKIHVYADLHVARGSAIFIGKQKWHDTAPPGDYDLRRAIMLSCNSYFITNGLRPGVIERVVDLGQRLHLGERVGHFPTPERVRSSSWREGDTANICIGQGEMDVTPMQMAVLASALANGGKVLQPRLVDRLESQDPTSIDKPVVLPSHVVRDELGVNPRYMQIVRDAMLAETEDEAEGGGRHVKVPGMRLRVCGKTGTAERIDHGVKKNTTWFVSFAPYERPRFAVVVMVENGVSGGTTCSPIAGSVFVALQDLDKPRAKNVTVATQ